MAAKAFIELFAGAGMARLGFGAGWRCLLANDNDPGKAGSYRANFGAEGFVLADVAALDPRRVREAPDVVWMSPPCQDVSLAGARAGLDGARSGAFWDAVGFVERLSGTGHAPGAIVLENVAGLLTSSCRRFRRGAPSNSKTFSTRRDRGGPTPSRCHRRRGNRSRTASPAMPAPTIAGEVRPLTGKRASTDWRSACEPAAAAVPSSAC